MSSPARFPEKEATPPLPSSLPSPPPFSPGRERPDADSERAQILIRNYCPRDIDRSFFTVCMWDFILSILGKLIKARKQF